MARSRPPSEVITEERLKAIVNAEISSAIGYVGSSLTEQRREATKFYLGEPFGDEVEGRSQIVMPVVRDIVEWALPQLLDMFTAGDQVVKFNPTSQEDVEAAEQETDYVNHIAMQDNDGFAHFYTWFKDALLAKNGIVKTWVEEIQREEREAYEGLDEMQVGMILEDDEVEPVQYWQDPETGLYDIEVKRNEKTIHIKWEPIPPEEFLISRRAVNIDEAYFTAHRSRYTESELIEKGYDPELVRRIPSHDEHEYNEERLQRFSKDEEYPYDTDQRQGATRHIWVTECYIRIDWDQDGVAELRKILVGGNNADIILENEDFKHDRPPFHSITPVPITHKFFGLSFHDLVKDLQKVKSVLTRQMLDNTYLNNNPRTEVVERNIEDMNDLLVSRPGGIVRVKESGSVSVIPIQPLTQQAFGMMEYIDQEIEGRTGVSRRSMGLDADALNSTASGINQLMTAEQMRLKLVGRNFGEGVKSLFKALHELARKHQDKERVIRMRNQWVPIDPRNWKERLDTTIEVGLGTGNKEVQQSHLRVVGEVQALIAQHQGGVEGPILTAKNVFNFAEKVAEQGGYRMPEQFFSDPDSPEMQQKMQEQAQEPPPDPKMIEVQQKGELAKAKLQADQQALQAKMQADQQSEQAKMGIEQAKLQMERMRLEQEFQLEMEKSQAELTLKREIEIEKIKADLLMEQAKYESGSVEALNKQVEAHELALRKAETEKEVAAIKVQGNLAAKQLELEAARINAEPTEFVVKRDKGGKMTGVTKAKKAKAKTE